MTWVNTKRWLIPPKTGYRFRVGNDVYMCYFTIWHYALIRRIKIGGMWE